MSRRNSADEEDSLDLLLDTVSNVFGGVMFLTLLAALLILTRGAQEVTEPEVVPPEVTVDTENRLAQIEMRQAATAIEAQRALISRIDPDGAMTAKSEQLASIKETIRMAKRQVRRTGASVADRQQELEDQQAKQSDLEEQIQELQERLAEKSKAVEKSRADSERTVRFRPLSRSGSIEAVVLLRYGRWYMLHNAPYGGNINRSDFYILQSRGRVTSITPKPHRGHPVTPQSLGDLTKHLKRSFPARKFHVTIAVWDDSFAEFNSVKDALKAAGYRYRTLTCDSSSRLSNQAAVDPFVQ